MLALAHSVHCLVPDLNLVYTNLGDPMVYLEFKMDESFHLDIQSNETLSNCTIKFSE